MKFVGGCDLFLLALLPFAAAQNCFCPGGADAPDPEKVVQLSSSANATCGKLQEDSTKSYLVQTHGCNYYRYYAQVCGCEKPQNYAGSCQLCQDGEDPTVSVQRSPDSSECTDYATQAMFDPFQLGCGYYSFLGSQCGCVKNRPPFDGCTLCADGSDPPLTSQEVRVPGMQMGVCSDVNDFVRFVEEPGSEKCTGYQATLGSFCGCNRETQPKGSCPICTEDDMVASSEEAPTFNYLSHNGETKIYQSGRSCLEAELLAHEMSQSEFGDEICSSIREQLSEACCQQVIALQSTNSAGATRTIEKVVAVSAGLLSLL